MPALLLAMCVAPAARALEQDAQIWIPLNAQVRLSDRVRLSGEVQPRLGASAHGLDTLVLSAMAAVDVSRDVSLGLGYLWLHSFPGDGRTENRLRQQAQVRTRLGSFTLVNRTRLEQRFFSNARGVSLRLRHRLRASHPLGSGSPWSVFASDEVFFHLNDNPGGPSAGFDQNRAWAGLAVALNETLSADFGYMAAYRSTTGRPRLLHNAVLSLSADFK